MPFKQVTQSNRIVKRGRGRLRNSLSALTIATAVAAAAAAVIPRILTFEPRTSTFEASLFLLNPFIKRLLMLTTVKALKCIKCINNKIISKSNKNCYNCDTSVIRCLRYAKGSYSNCTVAFAAANTAFDNFSLRNAIRQQFALDAALLKGAANSLSGLANETALALALAAFIAFVALAAFVALIIVAFFTLVITLTALAAALAIAITLAER
ncbi:hypothetical protein MBM_09274 [Drepanopeziza brunnea f. sp. 'multigermtubi' MB_m1]|uniref:Uncharacterized protein n=1 Tax=Marssonina brunnea f. sp. multigermtubi (strain MB_m1) TaxID=1072389 RepID=K1WV42_MARBU|nr:uncharacterized protein MBM_09274 [Drepanopeziza brunnea f. sp. 'multigermtubi' MB_m1]EKD12518.1 hypothetical protein MBM_09274 [Drepanopeziza brunnea f. sp. 'multigermtubi' MB_m1]